MWQLVYTAPELPNPFEGHPPGDAAFAGAEVIPFPAARPSQPLRKPVSMTVHLDGVRLDGVKLDHALLTGAQLTGVQLASVAIEVDDDDEP